LSYLHFNKRYDGGKKTVLQKHDYKKKMNLRDRERERENKGGEKGLQIS
jgi:hypothetical protein